MVTSPNRSGALSEFRPEREIRKLRIQIDSDLDVVRRSWGEVTSPATLKARTLAPEPGGLFCERIFGPVKTGRCACGKMTAPQEPGTRCPECLVEPISSDSRRYRLAHIALAEPVCHIWHYRGHGSHISLLTDLSWRRVDRIVHYLTDLITEVKPGAKERILAEIDPDDRLYKLAKDLRPGLPIAPLDAAELSKIASGLIRIESGARAIRSLLESFDPERAESETLAELESLSPNQLAAATRKIQLARAVKRGDLHPANMVFQNLPVLPPDLRPILKMRSGPLAGSDLNELYRKIINRNIRLKKLAEYHTPEIILRNEKRLLQNAVDALFDNATLKSPAESMGGEIQLRSLTDQIKGKRGRFRQNLLGKRVDYSGRAVIVSNPDLHLGQCGLPYQMAAELFRPFLIDKLTRAGKAKSKREAARLSRDYGHQAVTAALDCVASERNVILNRAPSLHRLSIQAFNPVLHEEKVIKLHPLSCGGFNADFDGDQMAVHTPLSKRTLLETNEKMRASLNLLSPASGKPVALPSLDMSLGLYHMTRLEPKSLDDPRDAPRLFLSEEQALLAYRAGGIGLREPIRLPDLSEPTSCGRILFNQALPKGTPFINEDGTKKTIEKATRAAIDQNPKDTDRIAQSLDDLKNLGFYHAFLSGSSIGMTDMITPPQKAEIVAEASQLIEQTEDLYLSGLMTDEERYQKSIDIWERTGDNLTKIVEETMPTLGDVYLMASSGAKGNISNIKQMVGMRGLMSDPTGKTIERPIVSNFAEGLSVLEYFISTHGARKGLADTALRTSDAGYLTRRLVDVTHALYVAESDCQTEHGREIDRRRLPEGVTFAEKLERRTLAKPLPINDSKSIPADTLINQATAERIERESQASVATIRSPLFCESLKGVCAACYGSALTTLLSPRTGYPAGVLAAQSVGEPGTQLTMRTFHRGGIAGSDITGGLPRVVELLEARKPKLAAELSEEDGFVIDKSPDQIEIDHQGRVQTYRLPSPMARFIVQKGQRVKTGELLTTGAADLQQLFSLAGKDAVCEYMISEIQSIYRGQGVDIADKHIEIIISRMFQRKQVLEPNDTDLIKGEITGRAQIAHANRRARASGGKAAEAKPILTGITTAALAAEGFLSAASFQNTSTILAEAAALKTEDRILGLKEHVIIGAPPTNGKGVEPLDNQPLDSVETAKDRYRPMNGESESSLDNDTLALSQPKERIMNGLSPKPRDNEANLAREPHLANQ